MEKRNEKKVLLLSALGVITLILVVVGATYAYFTAQGGSAVNTNVNVTTNTTDNLSFQVGSAVNITANQEDFASGMGNKTGSTTASATLTANNATNNATRHYYLYLDITSNDFEYTTVEQTAELILTITDPEGTPVTELSGYNYVTVGNVSGFDITTKTSLITLADNYEITSTGTVTQTWNVTITFVNLDSDQNANTGKSFNASIKIQEEPIQSKVNLASYITDTLYTEDGVNGLYYHDGVGDYVNADQEAGDNSYRFSGGDYQVTEKAIEAGFTRVYTSTATETDGVINFYCNGEKQFVGYSCDSSQDHYYTNIYNENVHYDTLEEALSHAVINDYLTMDNIKNFVCFGPGSESEECSEDNLYRIIGVFDGQVKLIKYNYADTTVLGIDGDYYQTIVTSFYSGKRKEQDLLYRYYWNGLDNNETQTNEWNISRLNKVNLNTNYWNYLTNYWQSKIYNTIWQIGGNTFNKIAQSNAKTVYTNEILNPTKELTYQDEIGLMYISDYMYAVEPSKWQNVGYENVGLNDYQTIKDENWMYMGEIDWTLTRQSDYPTTVFVISLFGHVYITDIKTHNGVRPVFYLNSDVEIYEGHAGTQSDPYRIVI